MTLDEISAPPLSGGTAEFALKRRRVLDVLDRAGREAVVLRSQAAIGWYLGGARVHVSLAAAPIVSVRVDRDADTVLVTSNEAVRLRAEELPPGVRLEQRSWFEPAPGSPATEEADLADELRAARAALLPVEQQRFRRLGRECAEALTSVLSGAGPGDSERRVAAGVVAALVERGIDPLVVLVGGSSRPEHRHPLPTAAAIGSRVMVVVCGRRHGLIANATRWLRFGPRTAAEERRDAGILGVEAAYLGALRPGTPLSEVLARGAAAYAEHGFDADEWQRHHQGGAAGYDGRDPRATPETRDRVTLGQPFAWNPTATGPAKVEDTVLLTDDGLEVLTADPVWPTITVGGLARPDVLIR